MICPNDGCKKKFNTPLEIYNGTLLCPYCKKEILTVGKLIITKENETLYNSSELYLMRYLSMEDNKKKDNVKIVIDKKELLNNAIKYCQESAKLGNPKAVFRMGFYYEYYFKSSRGQTERIKTALGYYESLCYYQGENVPIKKESFSKTGQNFVQMTNDEFYKMKRACAVRIVSLYEKYRKILCSKDEQSFENVKQKISSLYDGIEFSSNNTSSSTKNSEHVLSVLQSCFSKERAPLFGVFQINGCDYKELCKIGENKKQKLDFLKIISKGLEVRYVKCDRNGRIDDADRYFNKVASIKKAKEIEEELLDIDTLYLFFYNVYGKHKYLSTGQMNKIKNELYLEEFALLYRLITSETQEYLFFDDDIERFKNGRNVNGCIEKLIETICGE